MFANPDRVQAVCQDIVDHYLAGAYRNGLKAQVVAFNRELAVAYTDKINELLAGFEASQVLAEVGRHERITAEVNISVSDSKDEDKAMLPFRLSEAEEEEQKRRFLAPDGPLCFLVVTAKLMTAGEPFAIGYFVGSGNTPNKFAGRNSPFATADPTSPEVQEGCRVLDYCTTCSGLGADGARDMQIAAGAARTGSVASFAALRQAQPRTGAGRRLEMNFDEPGWTMQHVCTSPGCPASGALDVYVIDDDIYRRTPSVLVGTVDKLAQLGMQKRCSSAARKVSCPLRPEHSGAEHGRASGFPDPAGNPAVPDQRPLARHFHERSTLLPTVPAPSRAKAAEPAALTDRSGTRAGTIFGERGIPSGEAELHSLVRNPSARPILSQLQHAACRGMDPDVYHPDEGRPTELALARCFSCHARLACLGLALRAEDPEARSGWYGGLGPADRDALAASLGVGIPSATPVTDTAARAARLRAAGWTIGSIANELRCSRRTVQRYLRKAAA